VWKFSVVNLAALGGTQVALTPNNNQGGFFIVLQLRNDVCSNRAAENVLHAFTPCARIKKILAPTDFSPLSEAGIRYALNAARELGAEVIIYHAITGNEIAAFGRRRTEEEFVPPHYRGLIENYGMRLKSFIEEQFGDAVTSVQVRQKVEFGTPERSIVETAKTEGIDLIIMASGGKRGLTRMFLGSVTEAVIRNAPCPVVAIPANFAAADDEVHKAAA
jgi:nucleotide-binding universal stress UspA family protein